MKVETEGCLKGITSHTERHRMSDNEVTIKEAARQLGVPYKTLYGYIIKHAVPTRNVGNYRFLQVEAARAVLPAHLQRARKAQ